MSRIVAGYAFWTINQGLFTYSFVREPTGDATTVILAKVVRILGAPAAAALLEVLGADGRDLEVGMVGFPAFCSREEDTQVPLIASMSVLVPTIDLKGCKFYFCGGTHSISNMEDMVLTAKHLRNAFPDASESHLRKMLFQWRKLAHTNRAYFWQGIVFHNQEDVGGVIKALLEAKVRQQ